VRFSGYDWTVKSSPGRFGPGPNFFSDSVDNVFVDPQGRLHLKITHREDRWVCSEVISARSLGYGTYRFGVDSSIDGFDPQIVLGLFTWTDDPGYHHREIDIEISRWGDPANQNLQFVVQPYTRKGSIVRFSGPPGAPETTHTFLWTPDRVTCRSLTGHPPGSSSKGLIREHTFTQDIPKAGGENPRINLWLMGGKPPRDGKEVEAVISRFEFISLPRP